MATLLFAALWLATLVWGVHQRSQHAPESRRRLPGEASSTPAHAIRTNAELKRALDTGDLGDVADTLCAMATPPVHSVDELLVHLDDAAQREAIAALQRARWGQGEGADARRQLRAAFAKGPAWRTVATSNPVLLPPLYPGA
jgi:hypothetical protein